MGTLHVQREETKDQEWSWRPKNKAPERSYLRAWGITDRVWQWIDGVNCKFTRLGPATRLRLR
jgi:hypothetical protein